MECFQFYYYNGIYGLFGYRWTNPTTSPLIRWFGIDVPYPDEEWDDKYLFEMRTAFQTHKHTLRYKTPILVEAGVIRGGNYTYVIDWMRKYLGYDQKIITLALYENLGSRFKSDFVGNYYDNTIQDLTFWWERDNNHWK